MTVIVKPLTNPSVVKVVLRRPSAQVSLPVTLNGGGGGGRTRLTADTTFIVAVSGGDDNSLAGPFATKQGAIDCVANKYDLAGFELTIQVEDGADTSGKVVVSGSFVGDYGNATGGVRLLGNVATPANCPITGTATNIQVTQGRMRIAGFSFQSTTKAVQVANNSQLTLDGACNFGGAGTHLEAVTYGRLIVSQPYTISSSGARHLRATAGAFINVTGAATAVGAINFSVAYIEAITEAFVQVTAAVTNPANITGPRFSCVQGGSFTYPIPGIPPGSTDGSFAHDLGFREKGTVASAATINLVPAFGGLSTSSNFVELTGVASISSFGNAPVGTTRWVRAGDTASPTLVHSAHLLLPFGGLDKNMSPGDFFLAVAESALDGSTRVWRVWSYTGGSLGGATAPPNCFMAQSAKGGILVSQPCATTTARRIVRIFRTIGATTISLTFDQPHNFLSSDTIVVRVGGNHGTSWRRHPANGTWTPTPDPLDANTLILATRTVTEFDEAVGQPSKWGAGGHRAVTVDMWAWKNGTLNNLPRVEFYRLMQFLDANGGGEFWCAPNFFYMSGQDPRVGNVLVLPSNVKLNMGKATFFRSDSNNGGKFLYFGSLPVASWVGGHAYAVGDKVNSGDYLHYYICISAHTSASTAVPPDIADDLAAGKWVLTEAPQGSRNSSVHGGVLNGNRSYQTKDLGLHNTRGEKNRNIWFYSNVWANAGGYGGGWQGGDDTYFENCGLVDVIVWDSDSDGFDIKNRDDANEDMSVVRVKVYGFGLGNIGTHNADLLLGANPFTTVTGPNANIVTVSLVGIPPYNPDPGSFSGSAIRKAPMLGSPVTFYGVSGTVGGLDLNGTFIMVDLVDSAHYKIDARALASSAATGGGSGVHQDAPTVSPNDAGIDIRGHAIASGCVVRSPFFGTLTAFRMRAGAQDAVLAKHTGARWSSASDIWVENTMPFYDRTIASTADPKNGALGIDIASDHVRLSNGTARRMYRGLVMGPGTEHSKAEAQAWRCDIGGEIQSKQGGKLVNFEASECGIGAKVNGYIDLSGHDPGNQPFSTIAGSPIVTCTIDTDTLIPLVYGMVISFYDQAVTGGLVYAGRSGNFGGMGFKIIEIVDPGVGPGFNRTFRFNLTENDVAWPLDTVAGPGAAGGGGNNLIMVYPGIQTNANFAKIVDLGAEKSTIMDLQLTTSAIDTQIRGAERFDSGAATATLTFTGQPANGETFSVVGLDGTRTYTFRTTLNHEANGEVLIGYNTAASRDNLAYAINAGPGPGLYFSMATVVNDFVSASLNNTGGTKLVVTARAGGTDGNLIGVVEAITNATLSGATLSGGGNGQAYEDNGVRTDWQGNGLGFPTKNVIVQVDTGAFTVNDPTDLVKLLTSNPASWAVTLAVPRARNRRRRFVRPAGTGTGVWNIGPGLLNLTAGECCEVEYVATAVAGVYAWEVTHWGLIAPVTFLVT